MVPHVFIVLFIFVVERWGVQFSEMFPLKNFLFLRRHIHYKQGFFMSGVYKKFR